VRILVCERLGYASEERITAGPPQEIAGRTFSDPNLVILIRPPRQTEGADAGAQKDGRLSYGGICFGLKEGEIIHSRGLITKDEVRAVTVHKLRLPETGVLWDIGAGSGSLSIEAARLCPGLRVCAVDRDDEQVSHIRENRERFGLPNMEIIRGEAPHIFGSLPDPDRVCVGGSGGSLPAILAIVAERMPAGVVVVNAVTLETVDEAVRGLEARGFRVDISQVSVSRSKELGGRRHLTALNPVFIVSGEKV
jgi:precorrin-6B C5,15-methyltransferase / cobalt-precorrin-6B C5,C15-methyltransferase